MCLGVLQEPILFLKPTSSFLQAGMATIAVEIPEPLESLHHKVELAVVISRRGRDVPEASAMDFVRGNLRIVLLRAPRGGGG
jgi:acylpyruvate hydrolase